MDKSIVISYDGKNYQIPLLPDIVNSFYEENQKLSFDSAGRLIRKGTTDIDTLRMNETIQNVFLSHLEKVSMTEQEKKMFLSLKEASLQKNSSTDKLDAWVSRKKVDQLALLYYDVCSSKKKEEKREQQKIEKQDEYVKRDSLPPDMKETTLSQRILSSKENPQDNLQIAKEVLKRAGNHPRFATYFTDEKTEHAFDNIVICQSEEEFKQRYLALGGEGSRR